jgi:hypothetical protein
MARRPCCADPSDPDSLDCDRDGTVEAHQYQQHRQHDPPLADNGVLAAYGPKDSALRALDT